MHSPAFSGRGGNPYRAILAVLAAGFLLSGCYTLLRHPDASDAYVDGYEGDCAQCHDDGYATPGYSPWVEYYTHSTWPWINYYGSPWWADEVWVRYPDGGDDGQDERPELSGRQAWVLRPRGGWFGPDSTRIRNPLVVPSPVVSAPPSPAPAVGASQGGSGNPPPAAQPEKEKEEPRKRQVRR